MSVAKKYKVNWGMIRRLNGITDPELIRPGQELKIITGRPSVLVRKSDFALALLIGGIFVKEYRIGIGTDDRTPSGAFVIDNPLVRPVWNSPVGKAIKYGEEGYQLGERWLGFKNQPGATGLGIHGTNQPDSIGTKCSNGCIRMLNKDVMELYDFVGKGTKVEVVD